LREHLLTMGSLLVERRDGVEQLAAVPDNSYLSSFGELCT
jgi:hypothetical protein